MSLKTSIKAGIRQWAVFCLVPMSVCILFSVVMTTTEKMVWVAWAFVVMFLLMLSVGIEVKTGRKEP